VGKCSNCAIHKSGGFKISISNLEKETIISFNESEQTAHICTRRRRVHDPEEMDQDKSDENTIGRK